MAILFPLRRIGGGKLGNSRITNGLTAPVANTPKTFYLKNAVPSGATLHRSLQDGGQPPVATIMGGWVAGTNVTGQSCIQNGGTVVPRADAQWGATLQPSTTVSQTIGDACRSENTLSGTFDNTDWNFAFGLISTSATQYTGTGKLAVRLYRSTDPNGASATEITSGRVTSSTTTALSKVDPQNVFWSWTPGSTVTLSNEYLFVQVGWEIVTAGSGILQNVVLCVDGAAYQVITPIFSPTFVLNGDTSILSASATGAVGNVTATAATILDATIAITGNNGTGAVGTTTQTGNAIQANTASGATGSVGSVTTSGTAAITITASGATGSVWATTQTGSANNAITAIAATGSVGNTTQTGSATKTITATGSTGSVGSTTQSGSANNNITASGATGSVSTTTQVGSATNSITSSAGTGQVGTVSASAGGVVNVNIAIDASEATGLVGSVSAQSSAAAPTKQGGDDAPRKVKKLKYQPRLRKDDFGNEILDLPIVEEELEPDLPEVEQIAETINIYDNTEEKYALKQTQDRLNELQSHLEIIQKAIADELDDEEAILMLL